MLSQHFQPITANSSSRTHAALRSSAAVKMAAGPTPPASRPLSSWPPPAASKCVDGPLLPGAAKREVRRNPGRRVPAVAHQDLPRTPSAATSSPWLDLRARIAQDGPPSCSERPRTSALRWRDCTWSREHRETTEAFSASRTAAATRRNQTRAAPTRKVPLGTQAFSAIPRSTQ